MSPGQQLKDAGSLSVYGGEGSIWRSQLCLNLTSGDSVTKKCSCCPEVGILVPRVGFHFGSLILVPHW